MLLTKSTYGWTWGVIILVGLFSALIGTYAIYKKLGALEEHFKNLDSVHYNRLLWGNSYWGRVKRLAIISTLITSKTLQAQEPGSIDDIQRLPRSLRRWALYPFHLAYLVSASGLILGMYGRYTGLLK